LQIQRRVLTIHISMCGFHR